MNFDILKLLDISYSIQHFFKNGRHIYIIIWTIFVIFLDGRYFIGYNFLETSAFCLFFVDIA